MLKERTKLKSSQQQQSTHDVARSKAAVDVRVKKETEKKEDAPKNPFDDMDEDDEGTFWTFTCKLNTICNSEDACALKLTRCFSLLLDEDTLVVEFDIVNREVVAKYKKGECSLEIGIVLPDVYPLKTVR